MNKLSQVEVRRPSPTMKPTFQLPAVPRPVAFLLLPVTELICGRLIFPHLLYNRLAPCKDLGLNSTQLGLRPMR